MLVGWGMLVSGDVDFLYYENPYCEIKAFGKKESGPYLSHMTIGF